MSKDEGNKDVPREYQFVTEPPERERASRRSHLYDLADVLRDHAGKWVELPRKSHSSAVAGAARINGDKVAALPADEFVAVARGTELYIKFDPGTDAPDAA